MDTNLICMKRFKLILYIALLFRLAHVEAFAQIFYVDGIVFRCLSIQDKTVEVFAASYYDENIEEYILLYPEYSGNMVIPASVTYSGTTYNVTSIGERAFSGCTGLTSIEIPNSVTSIGKSAFAGCNGLKKAQFASIESLCGISFTNNTANPLSNAHHLYINGVEIKNNLVISNSVTNIGSYAFSGCTGLTSIEIPNSVTSIDYSAFYGCTGIQSLTIGSGVTSIGSDAFNQQPAKTIWLCNTVPTGYSQAAGKINYVANNNFSGLSNVTVYPYLSSMFEVDGIKYVPVNPSERTCDAIDGTYALADSIIQIKETVSYKGISMNVKKIQPYCCYGNNNIKKVSVFPVKADVSNYAFQNCTGLDTVQVSNDGFIGESAFAGCLNLKTAIVSNNGNIGNYAFQNNISLQSVQISNANNLGALAFGGCTKLKTADVDVKGDIGEKAFQGNTSLQSIQISQANNLGKLAFDGCTDLETAVVNINGGIGLNAFQNCAKMLSIQLGESVKSIGNYAFSGCKSLAEIVVPNATKSIGTYCFQNCSAMQKAVLGNGIMTVPGYAFTGCADLQDITISSNVSTIDQYAFKNCSTLPQIVIPSAVANIGNYAFSGCMGLKNVVIDDRKTALTLGSNGSSPLFADCPLDSVFIGGKISYKTGSSYGYSPFYRNKSLRTVVITDEETQIYDNEFYGCTGLKNVKVGNGVESIGNYAFSGCSSLNSFAFGEGMKSIGKEAFSDCTALTEIYSTAEVPPTCGSQALEDINKWNCTLYVPQQNIEAYQAANQWKDFFFICANADAPQYYTLTYIVDGEVYQTFTIKEGKGITPLDEPVKEGYTFSGWSEIPATMPDNDVTVTGTFIVNTHDIIYMVDGEEYLKVENVAFGTTLTAIDAPMKEGYTFSGWSEIPATMPDNDVTVTGTFIVNTHDIIYMVDGEEYLKVENVAFGTTLTAIDAPTKEGYTFSGWSEIPATMPDNDVTVTGTFIVNTHNIIYMVDGEEYLKVENVAFGTTLTAIDAPTKEGYTFSGWSELPEVMPDHDVTVTGSFTEVSGLDILTSDDATTSTTFTLQGAQVVAPRQKGLYIRNGKKVMMK